MPTPLESLLYTNILTRIPDRIPSLFTSRVHEAVSESTVILCVAVVNSLALRGGRTSDRDCNEGIEWRLETLNCEVRRRMT